MLAVGVSPGDKLFHRQGAGAGLARTLGHDDLGNRHHVATLHQREVDAGVAPCGAHCVERMADCDLIELLPTRHALGHGAQPVLLEQLLGRHPDALRHAAEELAHQGGVGLVHVRSEAVDGVQLVADRVAHGFHFDALGQCGAGLLDGVAQFLLQALDLTLQVLASLGAAHTVGLGLQVLEQPVGELGRGDARGELGHRDAHQTARVDRVL